MEATVSCSWLQERMLRSNCLILDATLTPVGAEHQSAVSSCIHGALRFDLEDFSAKLSFLPHVLLGPLDFQKKVRELGVNACSTIITYDSNGIYSSPRVWWNFKLMGHNDVYILDGGINDWVAGGLKSASQHRLMGPPGDFAATMHGGMTSSAEEVLAAIDSTAHKIIDLRSSSRYRGEQEEPRPGLRKGHIPSSINIPFSELLNGDRLKEPQRLKRLFERAGCTPDRKLIFYCGSGVTACIGILAAFTCGFQNLSLYDGSWAEWGATNLPIANS